MKPGLQTPKVYLDANILVAYQVGMQKEPKHYPLAQDIFRQINSGRNIGIVSFITLMEVVNVFRRIKTEELKELHMTEQNEQIEYVKNESKVLYYDLSRKLLEAHRVIRLEECKGVAISNFLSDSLEIVREYSGVVRSYDSCRACKSNIPHNVHKSIGALDVLHVFIAKALGCRYFFTFDKGFKDIIGDSRIKDIEISVFG